ncbi:hypothetical protein [Absidia glauca]|uniref:Uncharacterized protein n=1 Tax=Absidia glauca TaxID=4829 RepID=A0A163KBL6_ABSGL|nr:hypothetical protein [Absidia glauca]
MATYKYNNNRNLSFGFSSILVYQDPAFIVTAEGDINCVVTGLVGGKTPMTIYCNHPALVSFVLYMKVRKSTRWFVKGEIDVKALLDPGSTKPRAKLTMTCSVFADLSMVEDDIFVGEDPTALKPNDLSKRKKKKQLQQQQQQNALGDDEKATQGKGLASVKHMDPFTNVFIAKVIEAIIFDAQVPPERLQKKAEQEDMVDVMLTDKYQKIKESFTKVESMVYFHFGQYFKCKGDMALFKRIIDESGTIKRAIPQTAAVDSDATSLVSMVDSMALGTDDTESVRSGTFGNKNEYKNSEGDYSSKQQPSSDPEGLLDEYIKKRFPSDFADESNKKCEYEITYIKIKKNVADQ